MLFEWDVMTQNPLLVKKKKLPHCCFHPPARLHCIKFAAHVNRYIFTSSHHPVLILCIGKHVFIYIRDALPVYSESEKRRALSAPTAEGRETRPETSHRDRLAAGDESKHGGGRERWEGEEVAEEIFLSL